MAIVKHTAHRVSTDEAKTMFEYWLESGKCISAVARKFNRNRKTIMRLRKNNKWDEKNQTIIQRTHDKIIEKEVQAEVTTRQLLTAIVRKVARELLQTNYKIDPRPTDFVALARLVLELDGDLNPEGQKPGGNTYIERFINMTSTTSQEERATLRANIQSAYRF